jgi:excisionase family DNA binding protein
MTSEELAQLLQVAVRTLDQWSYKGTGPPAIRLGRHRRYDPADVRAWLESQRASGTSAVVRALPVRAKRGR